MTTTITMERLVYTERSTIGRLEIRGWSCDTLEDRIRGPGIKVPGQTCIPAGVYQVVIDRSARFDRPMPRLVAVPLFTGIRIHSGNTRADTEGCILLGRRAPGVPDVLVDSRVTFASFFDRLTDALAIGLVMLDLRNGGVVPAALLSSASSETIGA